MSKLMFLAILGFSLMQHAEGATPSWACALEPCVLNSALASAGPAFKDIMSFNAMGAEEQSAQVQCSLDGDAAARESDQEPSVDVSTPGIEAAGSVSLDELRNKKEHDLLVVFYAPWCPHCKAFVTGANAPITTLSARLEKAHGPKVVTFDVTTSSPPYDLQVDSVPTIYLIKAGNALFDSGQPIVCNEDPHDLERLVVFALGETPKPAALVAKSTKYLRSNSHLHGQTNQSQELKNQSQAPVGSDEHLQGQTNQSQELKNQSQALVEPDEEEYVEPGKDFRSVGDVVQSTIMQPPKHTAAPVEVAEDNSTNEFVEPDKDFRTFAVVHGEKEKNAQEHAVLLAKSTKRIRSLTRLRGHANKLPETVGTDDEYVEPEKAFHSVGVEEFVTVVKPPPPSSPKVQDERVDQNSTDEFVAADGDFHTFGVVHGQEKLAQDQTFHVIGSPEEYVSPEEAFHPVSTKEEYNTVVKSPRSA